MAQLDHALASQSVLRERFPDFYIVGHSKCGTTALYEMLRRHPQVFMPDVKEPMFFARNPDTQAVTGGSKPFQQTGKRPETLEDYLSLFTAAGAGQRIGEASTFYLWSHAAPARIAAARPDARIIAVLREPASFLRSLHLQLLQNHAEVERDLRKAIALEDDRREGRHIPQYAYWPEALIYSERVKYVDQLRRYHAVFPRDQVLVLIYDDFRAENELTVRRVLRFLGVDDTLDLDVVHANATVDVRAPRLDTFVREVGEARAPSSRVVRTLVKGLTTSHLRRRVLYPLRRHLVYGSPQPADEQLMRELRRRYEPEVVALSEYLGRDLVRLWGYDGLG